MTRQQKWAHGAFQKVLEQKDSPKTRAGYRTLALKMPVLVQQSGASQALAFIWSRGEGEPERKYLEDLAAVYGAPSPKALLERAQGASLAEYMAFSRDLITLGIWFRRFAQSELPKEG
ncbi:MAG: type III-B CRISPR module-associated protein Cmr5 [Myxococcota bacterium]|jgi:CRISPR type III-B/RAMP module-associated protein Cmr5|nr:type III-B CRISPR module-associated protein Cmr5 [Myxococcota bacterium]